MRTATRCLLAYRGHLDPTPEQMAGAAIEAFASVDLQIIARAHMKG